MLEQKLNLTNRVSPLRELLVLAIPTIAQMASYTLLQFVDTWMLSRVGDREATAAGQAGGVQFSFLSFGFGILLLVNALSSQAFGRKDFRTCGQVMWQGIYVAIGFGLLLQLMQPFAEPMFLRLGHTEELASLEAIYFQILTGAAVLKLMQSAVSQFLISINRATLVLISAVVGCVVNVVLNWILIYGNLGMPAMGVAGAAWGTVGAIVAELLVMIAIVGSAQIRKTYHPFDARLRLKLLGQLLKLGTPAGLALSAEVMAWSLFNVWVIAQFGEIAMQGNNYAFRYMLIAFMPAIGVAHAVTALVGRYIGAGDWQGARRRAHWGFALASVYMVSVGVGLMVFGEPLIRLFTEDAEVIRIGARILIFMGAYQILDAMYAVYSGGLRGAGDTLVPSVVMIGLNWGLTVGAAYLTTVYFPEFGPGGPWTVLCVYGTLVGLFMLLRFQFGPWTSGRRRLSAQDSLPAV